MKIVQFKAENFKKLQAVEINPDGDVVMIGGNNGQGKSSILDAIWVALAGKAVAPPKPIRAGEEEATIELDLGRIKIIRKFREKDGKQTDSVKVESAEGLLYKSPQAMLDALVGEIGFDPLDFARMKPAEQADTLRGMVPLSIDLDDHAEWDASDYAKRRDTNRDAEGLRAQIAGIPIIADLPDALINTAALIDEIANAGRINSDIDQEERTRAQAQQQLVEFGPRKEALESRIIALQHEFKELEESQKALAQSIKNFAPLPDRVDIDEARAKLDHAETQNIAIGRMANRKKLADQLADLEKQSQDFTDKMKARAAERAAALAEAQMPIEGLAFGINDAGKPIVLYGGVPFEQSSDADKIRASTAIAMASNPQLRVLRVKDGSLLDANSMAIMAEMAAAEDFQLWVEVVGAPDGVGIIMENGLIMPAADAPKAKGKPKGDDAPAPADDASGKLI